MNSPRTFWEILVVDDEPDILQVTKLALKNAKVYGRPLKISCFSSAEETKTYLKKSNMVLPQIPVALIDVVMETDSAGLDLCRYIREDLKNVGTNLFVRTGQPGKAPERKVIDRYDISGYLHKVDLTDEKLYSIVKCGIRDFFGKANMANILDALTRTIGAVMNHMDFLDATRNIFESWIKTHEGGRQELEGIVTGFGLFAGSGYVGIGECADRARMDKVCSLAQSTTPVLHSSRNNGKYWVLDGVHVYRVGELTQLMTGEAENPDYYHHSTLEVSLPAFNALYQLATQLQKEQLVTR